MVSNTQDHITARYAPSVRSGHSLRAGFLTPAGRDRTLYSLRHTYATNELLTGTDIHTLARQMGTSVVMLERHYSKLTATMAATDLA